jgi:O-succinylhomoserine sulfhydrylase
VVAGALCASKEMVKDKFIPVMRSAGMSLSPFNAWVVLKGLETLSLRMKAQSAQALSLAQWLENHPKVAKVYFPGLPSHSQHALAIQVFGAGMHHHIGTQRDGGLQSGGAKAVSTAKTAPAFRAI